MPEGTTIEGSIIMGIVFIFFLWVLGRKSSQSSAQITSQEPKKVISVTRRIPLTLSKSTWGVLEKQAERKNMTVEEYVEHIVSTIVDRTSF